MNLLFAEELREGCKGPAVLLLQHMLLFAGINREIVTDGIYGPETARGVADLQHTLGFRGHNIDGIFGARTKRRLMVRRKCRVDDIQYDHFSQVQNDLTSSPS
jgi:peptidoglycan hydrolase-like protein with peptidoglycan-binding domain